MRYEVRASGTHLHVEVGGPFDGEVARRAVEDIFAACEASGFRLVLVDARGLDPQVSISDRFDLARALADRARDQVRLAVLVADALMVSKTLEDSASNRGVPVRTTSVPEEAYGFLGLPWPG